MPKKRKLGRFSFALIGLLSVAGCGGPAIGPTGGSPLARFQTYPRGSLTSDLGRVSGGRRVGCLDIRAERIIVAGAPDGTVDVAFSFGNRCNESLELSFGRIRVSAIESHGLEQRLRRREPSSVLPRRTLDGRSQGFDLIEYDFAGAKSAGPVCVDVSGVLTSSPEQRTPPICLTEPGPVVHDTTPSREVGTRWHARSFYFFAELSAYERTIGLADTTFSGSGSQGTRFELGGLNRVTTFGAVDHFNLRLAGPLYIGGVLRVGGGHLGPRPSFNVGAVAATIGSTVEEIGAGGLVGMMTRSTGGLRFRADVAVGRSALLVDTNVPNCDSGTCTSATAGRTWLEPRVVMDAWLTPWWTVSSWGAVDVLHAPDVSVGLALGFHVRSFDGFP
jgi:hypothetical protein